MNGIKRIVVCICTIIVLVATLFSFSLPKIDAFSPQVIQHGAIGDDVIELQARLKHIGFYTGPVDGVFGWRTYWALRNFQYEFGMEIDGIAGAQAKEMLVKSTEYNEAETKAEMYPNQESTATTQNQSQEQQTTQQTTSVNVPQGFSQNDIKLMANAV